VQVSPTAAEQRRYDSYKVGFPFQPPTVMQCSQHEREAKQMLIESVLLSLFEFAA